MSKLSTFNLPWTRSGAATLRVAPDDLESSCVFQCRSSSHCSFAIMHQFLLLVAWLTACTSAASLSPTLIHLTSPSQHAQSNGSTVAGDAWPGYCTKIERWSVPRLDPRDCVGVLDWFYIHTMHAGGSRKEEFIAPGAKKASFEGTQLVQWTPRKYTFGTVHPLLTHFLGLTNVFFPGSIIS